MVSTGAGAYCQYGFESTYNTEQTTRDKVFGLQQKISGLTLLNNQIPLSKFNSVQRSAFAFGQNQGRFSIEFILSNPWIFSFIFDNGSTSGTAAPFTYTLTPTKDIKSASVEVGADLETANQVRDLLGVVVNSIALRGTLNDLIYGTADVQWSKENAVGTSLDATPAADDINFPYTFEHGTIELPNSTVLAEIQSFDLTMNNNANLVWGFGDKENVHAYRGVLDLTGRINLSLKDNVTLGYITQRSEVATMKLKFSNGLAGASEKSIEIQGTGVSVYEHGVPNLEPNEPIWQDLPFQIRSTQIVAINPVDRSAEPEYT